MTADATFAAVEPAVRERPILFSGPMVRAILADAKTQTRRVVSDRAVAQLGLALRGIAAQVAGGRATSPVVAPGMCPYGDRGDRLWVRETWRPWNRVVTPRERGASGILYAADDARIEDERGGMLWAMASATRWRPSIYMPRWVSRLTLDVTAVRVERLCDISEADARAEGVEAHPTTTLTDATGAGSLPSYRATYARLWDEINGQRAPWESNPWVWAISFRRLP